MIRLLNYLRYLLLRIVGQSHAEASRKLGFGVSPSPLCLISVNGGGYTAAAPYGISVPAGAAISVQLASTAGVRSWSLTSYGLDEISSTPSLSFAAGPPNTYSLAFMNATGRALLLQSVVNGGVDVNGVKQASYTTTLGLFSLINGLRVLAQGETIESNPAGWIADFNVFVRNGGGGGGGGGGPTYLPASAPPNGTNNTLAVSSGGVETWNPVGGYQILSSALSGTGVATTVEVGTSQASVNVALTSNFTPTAITYSYSGVASGGPTGVSVTGTSSAFTITPGSAFTSNTNGAVLTVTTTVTDPAGAPHISTLTMTYAGKIVYGSLASGSETLDQTMWNALNSSGSVLRSTRGGSYNFASAFGQDQDLGLLNSLGAPTMTDPSTNIQYAGVLLGTASITENGTTQTVAFYKFANSGSTFSPANMS